MSLQELVKSYKATTFMDRLNAKQFNYPNHGNSFLSYPAGGGPVGGWKELGRTTLGSPATTLNVGSLANKRYIMAIFNGTATGSANGDINLNADTGSNYSQRVSINNGADGTATSDTKIDDTFGLGSSIPNLAVMYFANLSSNEKLLQIFNIYQNAAGAGAAPQRWDKAAKWANTANALSAIKYTATANNIATGSELVVLGWDPADIHTTNFWEELASIDSTGDQTASFTAKKYLWIQVYMEGTAAFTFRLGNGSLDSGTNYSYRNSSNNGADGTSVNATGLWSSFTFDALAKFYNFFMVNNSANNKLIYGQAATQSTAGAGTANNRLELAGKWANVSNQANRFGLVATSGTIGKILIKIWGHD